jgi:hypothetical protein
MPCIRPVAALILGSSAGLQDAWSVALQTDVFPQKILDPVNRRMTRARNGKATRPVDSHRKTTARGAQWLVRVCRKAAAWRGDRGVRDAAPVWVIRDWASCQLPQLILNSETHL